MKSTKRAGLLPDQMRTMEMTRKDDHPFTQIQNQPGAEETQFISFFRAVRRLFKKAGRSEGDIIDRFYMIGGHTIRLRFAGTALIPFVTPALEHLATQPCQSPSLTICAWDTISTNTPLPPLASPLNDYVTRGGIRRYYDDRFFAALYPEISILNILDTKHNLALYCLRDASQFPPYQVSSPLLTVLHWGMRKYGLQLVHAAAVGTLDLGGVLIVGKGGSGKSTIALACLNSELAYVGDDYCLLGRHPHPYVYNLYNSGKMDKVHIQRFPHLARVISSMDRVDNNKQIIFLHRYFSEKLVEGFPVRAILVPNITGRPETKLKPTSPVTGLGALAPSTMSQLSGAGKTAFEIMAQIVKQVPCYEMELGTEIAAIPIAIMDLLSHISYS